MSGAIDGGLKSHWFWGPFWFNRGIYGQVILAAMVSNLLALGSSIFIMVVYDRVIPNNAVQSLVALVLGMVVIIAFDYVLRTLRGYFIDVASRRADLVIGRALFQQMMSMDLAARRGSTGGYANTMKEFDTLRDFFASATLAAVVDLPFIFLFLGVIWVIGGPVALVPAVIVPVVLIYAGLVQPILSRLISRSFQEGASKQSVIVEAVSGLETLKSVGGGAFMGKRWEESVDRQSALGLRTRLTAQSATNLTNSAQQAVQVGIVFYGVFLIQDNLITMGALVACVILSGRCMGPLAQTANILTRAQHALMSYRALDALMKAGSDRNRNRAYLRRDKVEGRVAFQSIKFRYPDAHTSAINDITFTINPGDRVAILGRIGSGKSTLARLSLGLYEPEDGSILIDDTDIRQFDPADLRNHVGAMLQDTQLFSGTIRENIAIGHPEATDEAVLKAAQIAGVHDFVGHLPSGYDLRISEKGEGLSGGQRQAIALARALVADPQVLVLDEPTSALDTRSETALIERLREASEGKTMLVVTHKSSMLRLVNKIMIVEGGRIFAYGPREEVLRHLSGNDPATPPSGTSPPATATPAGNRDMSEAGDD
ncbi:MAG: type I secretion system permease/ATPase [Minwuia sp.]|nr:type I secretion system permease/ATPase [Minwuia sp.]